MVGSTPFRHQLHVSGHVLAELKRAPASKTQRATRLIAEAVVLEDPPGLEEVIDSYIGHRLVPAEAGGDAAHLAMASMCRIDYLLTWNCKPLANANKTQHLTVLNERLGLPVPLITTPLGLMSEDER